MVWIPRYESETVPTKHAHATRSIPMPCAPHSLVSACVLMQCAAIAQALQGYPDMVTVSFLLVGVTSVIHHCRLDAWWKRDVWRCLDYLAIVLFAAAATARFGCHPVWIGVCTAACAAALATWTGALSPEVVPVAHALMHLVVGFTTLWLVCAQAVP